MFISQYAPGLAQCILNAVGPIHVGMWEAGLNVYDPKVKGYVRVPTTT